MERRCVAIRILGLAPTSHGFAYVLTEGPDRLVDWARHRMTARRILRSRVDQLITKSRPLFVAAEVERNERSRRGRELNAAVKRACAQHGIMILCIGRQVAHEPGRRPRPVTHHEIGQAAAEHFPILASKLPRKRRSWDGSDDRLGILLAAAFTVAGWNHFKRPH